MFAFSALTLLVGHQEEHLACKKFWLDVRKSIWPVKSWVTRCWHGYLSTARCKWFPHSLADATATPSSLASLKSRMVYLSGASLPRLSWKRGCYMDPCRSVFLACTMKSETKSYRVSIMQGFLTLGVTATRRCHDQTSLIKKLQVTNSITQRDSTVLALIHLKTQNILVTRMWVNAQRDGRPAEHRWHPLFNAAKFGWRPLLDAVH